MHVKTCSTLAFFIFIFSRVHMAPGVSHIFIKDLQTFVRLGDVGFSVRVPSCKGRRVVQR